MLKRFLLAAGLMLLMSSAIAREVGGVKFDESAQVAGQTLVLNGAGVRSVMFMDMYVAGLYLPAKVHTEEVLFAATGPRRMVLRVLMEGHAASFVSMFRRSMEKSSSEQELAALNGRLVSFERLFEAVDEVKPGDEMVFDWLPNEGTRISVAGRELGYIAGADFNRMLLKIWIGDKPVQARLKKELLGE